MNKVTMKQAFIVSNPEGWSYSIHPDDDNSDYIRVEQVGGPEFLTLSKEEAAFIATALQRLINGD